MKTLNDVRAWCCQQIDSLDERDHGELNMLTKLIGVLGPPAPDPWRIVAEQMADAAMEALVCPEAEDHCQCHGCLALRDAIAAYRAMAKEDK